MYTDLMTLFIKGFQKNQCVHRFEECIKGFQKNTCVHRSRLRRLNIKEFQKNQHLQRIEEAEHKRVSEESVFTQN